MPVYKIKEEMPYDEFLGWNDYLRRFPIGWRDDQRTAMILQSLGVKAKPEQLFSSLATIKSTVEKYEEKRLSAEKFKRSGMFRFFANTKDLPEVLK